MRTKRRADVTENTQLSGPVAVSNAVSVIHTSIGVMFSHVTRPMSMCVDDILMLQICKILLVKTGLSS